MAGQIVVVSGTSAAGKTTTINTFAARSEEPYLVFGIDNLAGIITPPKFTYFGDRTREGWYTLPENPDDPDGPLRSDFGDFGWAGIHALHEMVAAAKRALISLPAWFCRFVFCAIERNRRKCGLGNFHFRWQLSHLLLDRNHLT